MHIASGVNRGGNDPDWKACAIFVIAHSYSGDRTAKQLSR